LHEPGQKDNSNDIICFAFRVNLQFDIVCVPEAGKWQGVLLGNMFTNPDSSYDDDILTHKVMSVTLHNLFKYKALQLYL